MDFLDPKEQRALKRAIKAEGFVHLESLNDGNCFFYSLETYYFLTDNEERADYDVLRQMVVNEIKEHPENYVYFIPERLLNNEAGANAPPMTNDERLAYTIREADKLGEQGAWNSQLGDFVPQLAATILGINIDIYEMVDGELRLTPVHIEEAGAPTIQLLRINQNHYDLLFPSEMYTKDIAKKWKQLAQYREEGAAASVLAAVKRAEEEEEVAAAAAAAAVKPKKRSVAPPKEAPANAGAGKEPRRSSRLSGQPAKPANNNTKKKPTKVIRRRTAKKSPTNALNNAAIAELLEQGFTLNNINAMQK